MPKEPLPFGGGNNGWRVSLHLRDALAQSFAISEKALRNVASAARYLAAPAEARFAKPARAELCSSRIHGETIRRIRPRSGRAADPELFEHRALHGRPAITMEPNSAGCRKGRNDEQSR